MSNLIRNFFFVCVCVSEMVAQMSDVLNHKTYLHVAGDRAATAELPEPNKSAQSILCFPRKCAKRIAMPTVRN